MDQYHCTFDIATKGDVTNWVLFDHAGRMVAFGSGYKNWHNAKRALDRHIKVIQSANFTPPSKPLRKEYTYKAHALKN